MRRSSKDKFCSILLSIFSWSSYVIFGRSFLSSLLIYSWPSLVISSWCYLVIFIQSSPAVFKRYSLVLFSLFSLIICQLVVSFHLGLVFSCHIHMVCQNPKTTPSGRKVKFTTKYIIVRVEEDRVSLIQFSLVWVRQLEHSSVCTFRPGYRVLL